MLLAVAAVAVKHQVIGLNSEILFLFQSIKEGNDDLMLQYEDMTAVEAHQVVVRGVGEALIHRGAGADIGDRDQLVLDEIIEGAVDGGQVEGGQAFGEQLVDLGGVEMLSIFLKDFEDGFSGSG
jgi:hypothetical protein